MTHGLLSLSLKVSISKKIELFLVEARYCERNTSQGCRKRRGAVGGRIKLNNYYTIPQFIKTSDVPALQSFGSDGSAFGSKSYRDRNTSQGCRKRRGAVGDASGLPITTRSPNLLKLPTSLHCNHSEVMDRHLGPSHVLSSIIDRSERKKNRSVPQTVFYSCRGIA